MRSIALAVALLMAVSPGALAHELHHSAARGEASIVTLTLADGSAFSYESYELFRPGEDVPLQVGRTDALGRIVFLPDRPGAWRVKAFSEDGHGLDVTIEVEESGQVRVTGHAGPGRALRALLGVVIILGGFAALKVLLARRRA
jgi:nickel transport protein